MLRAACRTAIGEQFWKCWRNNPGWGKPSGSMARMCNEDGGSWWSRQLFFNACVKKQPSVGCSYCQELAAFLTAAAACSHLFQHCPETRHVKNRNGWEDMQQPLWVQGAQLWHLACAAWWKAFLPWEGANERGAACQPFVSAFALPLPASSPAAAAHAWVMSLEAAPPWALRAGSWSPSRKAISRWRSTRVARLPGLYVCVVQVVQLREMSQNLVTYLPDAFYQAPGLVLSFIWFLIKVFRYWCYWGLSTG